MRSATARGRLGTFGFASFVALFLLGGSVACATAPSGGSEWELLGQRSVTDRVERDVIDVGASRGEWTAIRLEVAGRAVQFRSLRVTYANGRKDEIPLRAVIPAGGSSRVIDLIGRDRIIDQVEFVYDAQTRRRARSGGARVVLYGRR